MSYPAKKKAIYFRLSEFFIISGLTLFLLSDIISFSISSLPLKLEWLDNWFFCYRLENQITRILGLNPGGIWDGGFLYPFNKISILFDEPTWGISLLVTPVWALTRNIFSIYRLGGAAALFLSWIFTYYFIKGLGGNKASAFYGSAMFCLSGVSVALMPFHIAFWPFFLIPLLGIITLKIFSTSRLYWGALWGIVFGYLAWSSAHLFVMGGLFLFLFILWNLIFNNRSKKALPALLIGFIISGIAAAVVLGAMYLTQLRFGFYRGYYQPYLYASNWANLIYRAWPDAPFNIITKTPLWEYLKTNAKGELNIGISILLLIAALIIFIKRLKQPAISQKDSRRSRLILISATIISILSASLNIYSLAVKSMKCEGVSPVFALFDTYLYYIVAGVVIYALRRRILSAMKHLDFFLLLTAVLFGILSFGPYYLTGNKSVIASPAAFLIYHVPGFSGIQATARWGLLLSFTLSIAVAVFLSKHASSRRLKICMAIFMLASFLEVSAGFRMLELKNLSSYMWSPREIDIFLKNIPGNGAVLEMESYPVDREQRVSSDNSLGYALFSRLYHKKPVVTGYSSYTPHVINKYIFYPEDKTLSLEIINTLRKFGARYWVFHIDGWPEEGRMLFKDTIGRLRQIGRLDNGETLVYEDPYPEIAVTCYDIK